MDITYAPVTSASMGAAVPVSPTPNVSGRAQAARSASRITAGGASGAGRPTRRPSSIMGSRSLYRAFLPAPRRLPPPPRAAHRLRSHEPALTEKRYGISPMRAQAVGALLLLGGLVPLWLGCS